MLSVTLLVDFVNGIVPQAHIGEVFRVFLLLICVLILYKAKPKTFQIVIFIGIFLITNLMISILLSGIQVISVDVSVALKSTLVYIIANTLMVFKDSNHKIDDILKNNLIYGPGLIIVTRILGIGNSSYLFSENVVGFKSTFRSLNSINVALLILYIFTVSKLFTEKENFKWAIASVYTMIPMLMLGTKTSIAMIIIVPLLFLFLNSRRKKTWLIGLAGIVALFAIMFTIGDKVYSLVAPIINRQLYLFNQRDLWTYLTSARGMMVTEAFAHYFGTFTVLDIIPGRGYYDVHHALGIQLGRISAIPIEMDWADILVSYGLLGLLYTYVFSIRIIINTWRIRKNKIIQGYFCSAVILLLFGTFAGHLFLEAISSTFYAIVLAGLAVKTESIKSQKNTKI